MTNKTQHGGSSEAVTKPLAQWQCRRGEARAAPFRVRSSLCAVVLAGFFLASATAASATIPSTGWSIRSAAQPTNFSSSITELCLTSGVCDGYNVTVVNTGTVASSGAIIIRDRLPVGVHLRGVATEETAIDLETEEALECSEPAGVSLQCEFNGQPIPPGGALAMLLRVEVTGGTSSSVVNQAEVEGGGGARVETSAPSTVPNAVDGPKQGFAIDSFSSRTYGLDGAVSAGASEHPGSVSTSVSFTSELDTTEANPRIHPVQDPKTEIVTLPLGFVGNPLAAEQCPESTLIGGQFSARHCPAASQVGTVMIERDGASGHEVFKKLYNMVPEPGYPATFGFELNETGVYLRTRVLPSVDGYVLSVAVPDVPRSPALNVTGVTLTFFGDPAEQDGSAEAPAAFFTNPSNCGAAPEQATIEANSWVNPTDWTAKATPMFEATPTQAVSGCNLLQFDPTIRLAPETSQFDSPSGYEFALDVPQQPNLAPVLATPDLRDAEVVFPEGVSLSPAAADGLAGCAAHGSEGIELGENNVVGAGGSRVVQEGEQLGPDGLPHAAPGHCPKASQIGTVQVTTPLLPDPLEGHLYLRQPSCGQGGPACSAASAKNGELFGVYLEAEADGVVVKLSGDVAADPATGRLTTRFADTPQLPFSDLKLRLNGGPRAPLANPETCGVVTASSILTPWSTPFTPDATPSSSFMINSGPNGGPCPSAPLPFAPSFEAGTVNPVAGAFSAFTTTIKREDGQQNLSAISVTTPPGLLGALKTVPLCPEPQAREGTCSSASQIGHAVVGAGAGSSPIYLPVPGQPANPVYLTTGYKGAPFGLSVVVPAVAGPFNLGTVVTRAAINVDPHTAQITVTSDELPHILEGVVLRLRAINVTIDRPGFMFNPTSCNPMAITGTIGALQGATAQVSSHFQVTNCAALKFAPKFTASTSGKTSKAKGASLTVRVTAKPGEANIHKVNLQLPLALPSRLPTLQKACTEAQFNKNPAGCPDGSFIGSATAHTPVLNAPLAGPAILVSHGGAAFPDVEFLLQGEGVLIILDGKTDIKKGRTYSNFETVPDAPITSFETVLPTGPHSILGFYGGNKAGSNLCAYTKTVTTKKKVPVRAHGHTRHITRTIHKTVPIPLSMPTKITGQNGAVITQTTPITVTGCPKAKAGKAAKNAHAKRSRSKR